jgi:hypothetical protein
MKRLVATQRIDALRPTENSDRLIQSGIWKIRIPLRQRLPKHIPQDHLIKWAVKVCSMRVLVKQEMFLSATSRHGKVRLQ